MVDSVRHKEWFEMAKKDMRSAEILFEHDADNGIVCFHCQQAIEKYLKGFLINVTGELHEGHNLVKLCKKALAYNKALSEFIKDMAFVNTYYIETRYPAEDPLLVSKEDAEECIKIAIKVIERIQEVVNGSN
ncbi:DNA-binding protein [Fervidicella metallireducens AeB]|uniref:DNA-binding protein n=1 Tax=Fervidicella metallireducens AeB TaxID=1403537 RepID=A0A017RRM9_9CLOT|nr:HEPN domain-containing protein [Fervidicella metallireducens]EYE87312.1 DNA-binding protein [Fervidicella metallireducens AeB]